MAWRNPALLMISHDFPLVNVVTTHWHRSRDSSTNRVTWHDICRGGITLWYNETVRKNLCEKLELISNRISNRRTMCETAIHRRIRDLNAPNSYMGAVVLLVTRISDFSSSYGTAELRLLFLLLDHIGRVTAAFCCRLPRRSPTWKMDRSAQGPIGLNVRFLLHRRNST